MAGAARERTDKALHAIVNAASSLGPKREHSVDAPKQELKGCYAVDRDLVMFMASGFGLSQLSRVFMKKTKSHFFIAS